MLSVHPQITKYARSISLRTQYPIKNFEELMKALGGQDAAIDFDGPRGTAKELSRAITDDFFPVHSEEDLLKKSEGLRAKYLDKEPVKR